MSLTVDFDLHAYLCAPKTLCFQCFAVFYTEQYFRAEHVYLSCTGIEKFRIYSLSSFLRSFLTLVIQNERRNPMSQAFLQHQQATDSTVPVIEWMNVFELHM